MEKMKLAIEKRLELNLNYYEVDILYPMFANAALIINKSRLDNLQIEELKIKRILETKLINASLNLENNENHIDTITKAATGYTFSEQDIIEKSKEES